MKQLRPEYQAALDAGVTTLAYCVRIERRDGTVHRFTSHDRELEMLDTGAVYVPDQGGADITAIRHGDGVDPDNFDLEGALTASGFSRGDIAAGLFDFAEIYLFRTLWDDPREDDEPLAKGIWGKAELRDGRYMTEFRSLSSFFQQSRGRVFGPTCDADLGDSRCKVDLAPLTVSGSVQAIADRRTFTDSTRAEADDWFGGGLITMTSGGNAGISREVESFSAGKFTLWTVFPYELAVGDTYTATPGCRKRLQDCRDKYDNVVNFRGFPHLPGRDVVNRFGGQ
ncbi:DUF2163 domain-containing protein [Ectothiorhodospiraceae bacterium WFHF3C12]|nr:DUF2163 domain-containing protein [Ectothiorhodospiraceae bacterium WFHF3C12]